ncbi:MAG: FkbM family methyltransferase [Baekduiaceae bacterium]
MDWPTPGTAPAPHRHVARRFARRVLNSSPVLELQEDAFHRRARRDDMHMRVLVSATLGPEDSAIDIGAHAGTFLDIVLAAAPAGRHLAFEPLPDQARRLRADYPEVDVHEVALSDGAGAAEFLHVRENPGYSGLRRGSYPAPYTPQPITVRRARLDDLVRDDHVPRLVKIDVEGAELEVLRGGARTLARHRPVIVFEHYAPHADAYGTTAADLHALLVDEFGLRVFDIDGNGPLSATAMQSTADRRAVWSYIARP